MRHRWGYSDYRALCDDCGWNCSSKNALGLAAQHHDRTDHNVSVEIERVVSYVNDKEHARRTAERES